MHKRYEYMKAWSAKHRKRLNAKMAEYRKKHPNLFKDYYQKNLDKMRERSKDNYHQNKETIDGNYKIWYQKNKEKNQARATEWQKQNRSRSVHNCRRYYASKLNATPSWADDFIIGEIYDLAALRTKHTGTKWHVDHIVPLRSKRVCGLHVEHNLRVIPAAENLRKHNTQWPEMP